MASDGTYFDTDTKLMLHMDGADASTTFTDSSSVGRTVTPHNQAQIDTAQSVFGGASGLFDGTADYLTVPASTDFAFDGSFTIDFRIRFAADPGTTRLLAHRELSSNVSWNCNLISGTALRFVWSTDGTTALFIDNSWNPAADTWYHVAVVRSGTNLYMFIDGTQIGTTQTSSGAYYDSTANLEIGDFTGASAGVNGWIDELRIVKGTAVWTSNFTPPSTAYIQFGSDAVSGFSNLPLLGIG